MTIKTQLFQYCENHINGRIAELSSAISDLETDLAQETKSSAGDKYETAREMANAEINKLSGQIGQFQKMKQTLALAKRQNPSEKIQLGSLVETSSATYFISVPVGKIEIENKLVFAIGINSPIAQAMIGKTKAMVFSFRGNTMKIKTVVS